MITPSSISTSANSAVFPITGTVMSFVITNVDVLFPSDAEDIATRPFFKVSVTGLVPSGSNDTTNEIAALAARFGRGT